METLLKSFESFSKRHGNTAFFKAHPNAGDILSQVSPHLAGTPIHLTTSLEHAQNFMPHESAVEFILKPAAKIVDFRFHPRSDAGLWDLTHDEDGDDQTGAPGMPKSQLISDGLIDGVFHEFSDILEIHNPDVLIPVGVHAPIQPHTDVEALPIGDDGTMVFPEGLAQFIEYFQVDPRGLKALCEENMDLFAPDTDFGQRPAVSTVDATAIRDIAEYPMFKRDQPAIGAHAQGSAEGMARLLIFVVSSIKVSWPLMQNYFPLMWDALTTTGTVAYGADKPVWAPLVIGKTRALEYLWHNRAKIYGGLMRAYEADLKAGATGFLIYQKMILIPGLGVPKAGFATQLLTGKYGCIDSVNLNLRNANAPSHLMNKEGNAFNRASDVSIDNSGDGALTPDEYRSILTDKNITNDQKQLVTFLYGALTQKSLGILRGYADYLHALELEGTTSEQLWNIWCTVIAHKIHYAGGRKRPIDVVLPNQIKPSRVQAYAAIPKSILGKSQASVRNPDGKTFDSQRGGDVVSGDHRRLIRGESRQKPFKADLAAFVSHAKLPPDLASYLSTALSVTFGSLKTGCSDLHEKFFSYWPSSYGGAFAEWEWAARVQDCEIFPDVNWAKTYEPPPSSDRFQAHQAQIKNLAQVEAASIKLVEGITEVLARLPKPSSVVKAVVGTTGEAGCVALQVIFNADIFADVWEEGSPGYDT